MIRLFQGRHVLVLDGAMGTQLIARGLSPGDSTILLNVERPQDVRAVHQAYSDAGAGCLTTNTFGGSPIMLARYGLESRTVELNRAAVRVAREVAFNGTRLLGDIGPCGEFLEPLGDLTEEELRDAVKVQAEGLAGVDGFLVETMSDPQEMRVTLEVLQGFDLPIIATFTYEKGPAGIRTMMGNTPEEATRVAIAAGANAIGANCGTSMGLDDYLALGSALSAAFAGVPILLQPNAGTPVPTDAGFEYPATPDDFAEWAGMAVALEIRAIGGCCGTTPAHIGALVRVARGISLR